MNLSVWRRDPAPVAAPGGPRFSMPGVQAHAHDLDFTGFRPGTVEPAPEPPRRRISLDAVKARIRRYNAELDPGADTFRAAVILIAAYTDGQNVDTLARRTGYGRAFVAKCARRLIDNGVWSGGRTVAEWSPEDEASGAFWNDVAVAEGKLCRRVVEGRIEWAPAGYWNKRYDFVASDDASLSAVYHDPGEATAEADAPADDSRTEPAATVGETNGSGPADPESTPATPPAGEPTAESHVPQPRPHRRPGSDAVQLFPDAVWLG